MGKIRIISIAKPESPVSQCYKRLKINIQRLDNSSHVKTIMITSTSFQEGKSHTAVNLSLQFCRSGKKVLLLDCHQKKPDIHKLLGLTNDVGLTNVLSEELNIEEAIQSTSEENLYVLTSGSGKESLSKVLELDKFTEELTALRERFEYVIIDTPPLMVGNDAQIISQYVDGTIFVVASRKLDRDYVAKGKRILEKCKANILGVVLTNMENEVKENYRYYSKTTNISR